MKRIWYAETSFVTDSRIADALLSYARTLALVSQSDVAAVPGLDGDGVQRVFELVVGPSSQMLSHEVDDEVVPLDAEATVARLVDQQRRRLPSADPVALGGGLPADDGQDGAAPTL